MLESNLNLCVKPYYSQYPTLCLLTVHTKLVTHNALIYTFTAHRVQQHIFVGYQVHAFTLTIWQTGPR